MAVDISKVGDVMTPNVVTEDGETLITKISKEMELGDIRHLFESQPKNLDNNPYRNLLPPPIAKNLDVCKAA